MKLQHYDQLEIPDCVYNWVLDFFDSHAYCTKYAGLVSAIATIHASVIQGSALGPASYIVTAADQIGRASCRERV